MADDRERFERIYRENFRAVLRFAAMRIDPERAKDVAAETFLVAWRRLDDVPDEPRAWLLGVTRKVIAGQFRSQTRRDALVARLGRAGYEGTPDPARASRIATRRSLRSRRSGSGTARRSDSSRGTASTLPRLPKSWA